MTDTLVPSAHPELQPDIRVYLRHGSETTARCGMCDARGIYQYADLSLCRECATKLQATLNRLRVYRFAHIDQAAGRMKR